MWDGDSARQPNSGVMATGGLASHFRSKQRLQAANGGSVTAVASQGAAFSFNFDVSDGSIDPSSKKKKKKRKPKKKKPQQQMENDKLPTKQKQDEEAEEAVGMTKPQLETKIEKPRGASSTFLTLRKATGGESEAARMQLRYGQGRRNLAATAQRARRKAAAAAPATADDKSPEPAATTSSFKFNFLGE